MNLLDNFKNYLFSQEVKPSRVTVKNYLSDINHFVKWFEKQYGNLLSSPITNTVLDEYRAEFDKSFSPASMQRHLSSLRKFFKYLKSEGKMTMDPFAQSTIHANENKDVWRLNDFKNNLFVANAAHLTIKNYIIDVKQFVAWAKEVTGIEDNLLIKRLDKEFVEEYKLRLVKNEAFSPATVNRKLSSLRKYLTWAQNEGLLTQNLTSIENINEAKQKLYIPSANSLDQAQLGIDEVVKEYSKFPPLRLMQKLSNLGILGFDALFTAPLVKIATKTQEIVWKLKGQPIFEKGPQTLVTKNITAHDLLGIKNISKQLYAPFKLSIDNYSPMQKLIFHARYTRPNWYKRYHSYAITHYFHFAVLVIFLAAVGFGIYNSFFTKPSNQNPALAALPTAPPRILSFQGRLTDNNDNPITTANTLIRFAIYNDLSASGGALLWQEVDPVNPDTDGIFNSILGNISAIPSTLFSENAALYLGVTIESTPELTPRQQLATVAYAANSETLQGLLPITGVGAGTNNVVLALDSSGNLTIGGSANPVFSASGGQFKLSGQPLLLTTNTGTDANVQITTDDLGKIDLQKPILNSTNSNNVSTAVGAVEVNDLFAVLATSSGQSAVTINQTSTGPIISASSGGTAKFTIDNSGNETLAGNLDLAGTTGVSLSGNDADLTFSGTGNHDITASGGTLRIGAHTLTGAITGGNQSVTGLNNLSAAGTVTFSTFSTDGGLIYTSGTGVLSQITSQGTSGDCLKSNGAGSAPSFSSCSGASSSLWRLSSGAISPINDTVDLLVGSNATTSAKFAILNVAEPTSGYPTASISSGLNGYAAYLNSNGNLGTTRRQSLTIGNTSGFDTTGNVLINPNGTGELGIGTSDLTGTNSVSIGGSSGTLIKLKPGTGLISESALINFNSRGLIGYDGSTQAIVISDADAEKPLTFLTATSPASSIERMRIDTLGRLGLGTSSPTSELYVTRALTQGTTGKTLAIFDQIENQEIITASKGGVTQFVVDGSGNVAIEGSLSDYTGTTLAVNDNLSITGNITLTGTLSDSNSALTIDDDLTITTGTTITASSISTFTTAATLGMTSTTTLNLGNAATISSNATDLNLQADGTIDVDIAGGSGATGCTIDNPTGDLVCTGNITSTGGSVGYWGRVAGNISPATTNDTLSATSAASTVATFTSSNPAGTLTNNTLINQTGAGTVTNLLNLTRTAGTVTNGIAFTGTIGNELNLQNGETISNGTDGRITFGTADILVGDNDILDSGANTRISLGATTTLTNTTTTLSGTTTITSSSLATFTTAATLGMTSTTTLNLGNAVTISSNATALNLEEDGGVDINLGGGSGSTGCTITNASGNLACSGDLTITGGDITGANSAAIDIGEATSGDVEITGDLLPSADATYDLGSTTKSWRNGYFTGNICFDDTDCTSTFSTLTNLWRTNLGAISPINDTLDFLIGSNATTSAKFAILNVAEPTSGYPTASISSGLNGYAAYLTANGTLGTTRRQTLTIGNSSTYNTTGNVLINSNGTGNVGIGTTSPLSRLDVGANSGTTVDEKITVRSQGRAALELFSDTADSGGEPGGAYVLFNDDGTTLTAGSIIGTIQVANTDPSGTSFANLLTNSLLIGNREPQDIQFGANSIAGMIYTENNTLGLGTLTPTSQLYVTRPVEANFPVTGKSLAIFDQIENQDIITASKGGVTQFTVQGDGDLITLGDLDVNGDDIRTDGTLTLTPTSTLTLNSTGDMTLDSSTDIILDADGADIILKDATTEFGRFTNTGTSLVIDSAGSVTTIADDLAITGGNITTAITADSTLTVAGTLTANGIVNLGDGGDAITINGSSLGLQTTGAGSDITLNAVDQIILSDFTTDANGVLYTDTSGFLKKVTETETGSQCLISGSGASGVPSWGACGSGGGGSLWRIESGAISPVNDTVDLLVGSNATASAKFTFTGLSDLNNQTRASISGQLIVMPNNGFGNVGIGTTNPGAMLHVSGGSGATGEKQLQLSSGGDSGQDLSLGYNGSSNTWNLDYEATRNFRINENSLTSLVLETGGIISMGIGSGSTGDNAFYLTRDIANFGATGKALAIFDQIENQDIFTASKSGTTRFVIDQNGNVGIKKSLPLYDLDVSGTTIGNSAGAITLKGQEASGGVAGTGSLYLPAPGGHYPGGDAVLSGGTSSTFYGSLSGASITAEGFDYSGASNIVLKIGRSVGGVDGSNFLYVNDNSGNTRMTVVDTGNVGIGDTTPDAKLEVLGTSEQLRLTYTDGTVDSRITVNSSGDLTIDGSTDGTGSETFTLTGYSTLTASTLATLTTAATLGMTSTTTLNLGNAATISSNATALNLEEDGGVDINLGGGSAATGCTVTNSNGNLTCSGAISGSIDTALTLGSVVFAGTAGVLSEDNANFFFNDTTNNLGIRTSSLPSESALVLGSVSTTEGGQIQLNPGSSGSVAWYMDVFSENLRLISGTTSNSVTTRFKMDSVGKLGLGTENNTINAQLDVTRPLSFGVTGKALAIFDQIENQDILTASKGGSTKFVIDQNGNVGIGSTTPNGNLEINGNGAGTVLGFPSILTVAADSDTPWGFTFRRSDIGVNSDIALYNGATASSGEWDFAVGDGSGGYVYPLYMNKTNAIFYGGSTGGNVGIGIASPISELQVTRPLSFGVTGKALAIFDQIEDQDIIAASKSGTSRFTVTGNGNVIANTNAVNPTDGIDTFSYRGTGSYGGGIGFEDGATNIGLWTNTTGDDALVFGYGTSLGSLTEFARIDQQGDILTTGDLDLNGDDLRTDGDLTITATGGNIISSSPLNIGGAAATAYNFFADSTATNATAVGDNDLYIEDDLEVDGTITGNLTGTVTGSATDLNCTNCIGATEIDESTIASTSLSDGANIAHINVAETITGGWNFTTSTTTFTSALDANGDVSIADTNVAFDGASTILTMTGTASIFSTGDTTLDSSTDINLDAAGSDILLKEAGTTFLTISDATTDVLFTPAGGDMSIAGDLHVGNVDLGGDLSIYSNTSATSGTVYGTIARIDSVPTSASTLTIVGLSAQAKHHANASQGISAMMGLDVDISNSDTTTVGTSYGINVDLSENLGTLTNTYGIYIGDLTSGTQTNTAHSIYQSDAGTYNYFSGNIGIDDSTPSYPLQIGDGSSTTNNLAIYGASNMAGFWGTFGDNAIWSVNRDIQAGTFVDTAQAHAEIRLQSAVSDSSVTFWTTTSNNAQANQRMTLDKNGNLGIGDTSPASMLTVGNGDLFQVNSSGIAFGPDGSVSAPTYGFTSNTDVGMYYTTNTLNFAVNGTRGFYIDSTWDVHVDNGVYAASNWQWGVSSDIATSSERCNTTSEWCLSRAGGVSKLAVTTGGALLITGSLSSSQATVDVAEDLTVFDHSVEAGDIVISETYDTNETNLELKAVASKSNKPYQGSIIGAISTNPGIILNDSRGEGRQQPYSQDQRQLAIAGRVPVKVSTINGKVKTGDLITSSVIPGMGMKATNAGTTLGIVMTDYEDTNATQSAVLVNGQWQTQDRTCNTNESDCYNYQKVLVLISMGWHDPDVYLTSTGNLNITDNTPNFSFNTPHLFTLNGPFGLPIERIGAFSEIIVAKIKAGFIEAQQISTNSLSIASDNVSIAGQSLYSYISAIVSEQLENVSNFNSNNISSPIASIDTLKTGFISPLGEDTSVGIKVNKDKIEIVSGTSATNSAVASFDDKGNATLSGTLTSAGINSEDASISGTLRARRIIADQIEGLDIKAATVAANYITNVTNIYNSSNSAFPTLGASASGQTQYAFDNGSYINIATFSSQLAYVENLSSVNGVFSQNLTAFGTTTLSDTSIVGQLAVGGSLILANNSINVLGNDLNLQPLRQGGISIMAGLIYIDTNGNVKIGNDATIEGTLYANQIAPINNKDLTLKLSSSSALTNNIIVKGASNSAVFAIDNLGNLIASGAASIAKLNINNLIAPALAISPTEMTATGSAGTGKINAGRFEMTINNSLVTEKSLIYITPTSNTQNQVLYLLRQVPNESFTVGIQSQTTADIPFNWIIIN